MHNQRSWLTVIFSVLVSSLTMMGCLKADELLVYTTRNASYLTPLFDRYSAATGTAIRYVVSDTKSLIRRLESEEGDQSADLFIATGVMNLSLAAQKGLLAKIDSRVLKKNIPDYLRSSESEWFAFATRTEAIVYAADRVNGGQLSSYEILGHERFKGKLCLRSSRTEYTQSLLSGLMQRYGVDKTEAMVKSWVANLAVKPMSDDMDIIKAVDKNTCDVAIVNSYYLPRYLNEFPSARVKIRWPDQDVGGSQFDITGAGVIDTSVKKSRAIDLLEWIMTKEAQAVYASVSMEHPVNPKVYPPRPIAKYGALKLDQRPIETILPFFGQVFDLAKSAGYR